MSNTGFGHTDQIPPPSARSADERFERAAAELLRASAGELDSATQARLIRARRAALAAGTGRTPVRWWQPAVAMAAAAVVAVALWLGGGLDNPERPPAARLASPASVPANVPGNVVANGAGSDMEFLLTDTNLEMIQDLEFFAWLDADRSDAELRAELESVDTTGA